MIIVSLKVTVQILIFVCPLMIFRLISLINRTFNNTKEVITETVCNLEKSETQLDENEYTNNIYGHKKMFKNNVSKYLTFTSNDRWDKIQFYKNKTFGKTTRTRNIWNIFKPEKCQYKSKELEILGFTFERKIAKQV